MELSNKTQNIDKDTWYYEDKKGIDIIHWITEKDGTRKAINIVIPWRKIRSSFNRHEKK